MTIERFRITDRAAWLQWRAADLTASDIAAVAGVDEYRTALQVYGEKTGRLMPQGETNLMRRGRWMEGAALIAFRELRPDWHIVPAGIYIRDPELRIGATPDFIAEPPDENVLVNVQVKTVTRAAHERWEGRPPLGYQLQTLTEGLLLDAARSELACLVLDTYSADMIFYDVPRHPKAEAELVRIAREFWANIAAGKMPKPDYKRDAGVLAELYPPDATEPAPRDLTGDNRLLEVLEQRDELQRVLGASEAAKKALDAEIVEKLAGSTSAIARGWKIKRTMVNVKERLQPAYEYPRMTVTKVEEEAA